MYRVREKYNAPTFGGLKAMFTLLKSHQNERVRLGFSSPTLFGPLTIRPPILFCCGCHTILDFVVDAVEKLSVIESELADSGNIMPCLS